MQLASFVNKYIAFSQHSIFGDLEQPGEHGDGDHRALMNDIIRLRSRQSISDLLHTTKCLQSLLNCEQRYCLKF